VSLERLDAAERAHRPEHLDHAGGVGDGAVAVERAATDRHRELNRDAGESPGRAIHDLEAHRLGKVVQWIGLLPVTADHGDLRSTRRRRRPGTSGGRIRLAGRNDQ